MKRYVFIAATLILSACAPTTHQENSAAQRSALSVNAGTDAPNDHSRTDRIIQEDVIIGGVLGGLVGAFLDADRDDRIHASEVRYHRACNQGNAYFSKARQTRDLEERIAFMQEGIRYCPDNPAAHNDLGLGLMLWGDLTAARTQFAYALRLEPDYNPALINLSRIQYNQQPGQKKGHRSERSGPAARDAGNAVHRGSRERLIRHYQNSEEHLERRKKWSDRQKKLIKQNGGFD